MMFWISSPTSDFKFNKEWSEPRFHYLNDKLTVFDHHGKVQGVKKIGAQLRQSDTVKSPGIYLIRDEFRNNIYCGKSDEGGDLISRLISHFSGNSQLARDYLKEDTLYIIRWAVSSKASIAEALGIIFFEPCGNRGHDWKASLKRADPKALLEEAKRLGFYTRPYRDEFVAKLITQCRNLKA
jgi:hypothetical protein